MTMFEPTSVSRTPIARVGEVRPRQWRWILAGLGGLLLTFGTALTIFWGDVVSTDLDPKVPFQTYRPPPAPNYDEAAAWHLRPAPTDLRDVDVFFIGPTTYDGGRNWNARIGHPKANRQFREIMAPNYVGPFMSTGRIFAPKYRQASLYSLTTLREDAREARQFAYGDVRAAFRHYIENSDGSRLLILVGVEQGGTLLLRLLSEEVSRDPLLRRRLVAAYAIEAVAPADDPPLRPCRAREGGCLAAWVAVDEHQDDLARRTLDRALAWTPRGELLNLSPRPALCFNPILRMTTDAPAPARLHLGAANATGLEWDTRPAFMARQVAAQCRGGVLRVTRSKSPSLRRTGSWADRRKAPGYNLFYADIEADVKDRLATFRSR